MKRLSLATLALLLASPVLFAREPQTDPRQWMIELEGEPAVESWLRAGVAGRKAALGASVARVTELESAQVRVEELLTAPEIGARVQYRTQRVFNGIAVFVDPSQGRRDPRPSGREVGEAPRPPRPVQLHERPLPRRAGAGVAGVRERGRGGEGRDHRQRHRLPARRLRRERCGGRLPGQRPDEGARRLLPDRARRRRVRLRRRQLRLGRRRAEARPRPDGLRRTREPRGRHRRRLGSEVRRHDLPGALGRQRPVLLPAHRPGRRPEGEPLRAARLRLLGLDRPRDAGARVGDRPEQGRGLLRPPRRRQHVARLGVRGRATTPAPSPPTTPPGPASWSSARRGTAATPTSSPEAPGPRTTRSRSRPRSTRGSRPARSGSSSLRRSRASSAPGRPTSEARRRRAGRSGTLAYATPADACADDHERGRAPGEGRTHRPGDVRSSSTKVKRAQDAGAIGVVDRQQRRGDAQHGRDRRDGDDPVGPDLPLRRQPARRRSSPRASSSPSSRGRTPSPPSRRGDRGGRASRPGPSPTSRVRAPRSPPSRPG